MRPAGELRKAVAAALVAGGGTTQMLAQRMGRDPTVVRSTLDNMVRAGAAAKARAPVRVPGVKRPVPWYEAALGAAAGGMEANFGPLAAAWSASELAEGVGSALMGGRSGQGP